MNWRRGRGAGASPIRRFGLVVPGAVLLGASALAAPAVIRPVSAAPPVVTPQSSQTYANGNGVVGWSDPNGPPAPTPCNTPPAVPWQCDREQFDLEHGTSPLSDVYSLIVTIAYTNSNTTPDGPNCLDVAIEDSSASTVYAHATCAPTGAVVTDPNATPGTIYTVEVDGNATNGVATPQPFSYTVSATASPPAAGPSPTPPQNPADVFTFTHQISVDIQHGDGEPDLAIDPQDSNTMFSATPWGFSTTVSLMWRSIDGGAQWNNLHGAAASDTACPDPVAVYLRPDCSRGGGDAEVQFSQPSANGNPSRVQFGDLNGLDSISCAYSDNLGNTFTDLSDNGTAGAACDEGGSANAQNCAEAVQKNPTNPACAVLGTDRPWEQVWPAADQGSSGTCGGGTASAAVPCGSSDQLFMIFDTGDQPPSGDAAITSENNGGSWSLQCSTVGGSSCIGGSNGVGSRPGPLVINPTLIQTVGGVNYPTLYEFLGTNSDGTEVNISCDGGQTWTNVATSNNLAGSTTNDFVAGAMDSNGELYTAFTVANDPNPWRVWFNHSIPSGAKTVGDCSKPVQADWDTSAAVPLTGPPSSADGVGATPIPSQTYAVMPWIAAGSSGRVDVVYYGSTASVGLSPDNAAATWYLHMAQSLDGGSTWTDEQATETPMHLESICFSGIGCTAQTPPGGDRNLLDFFQVKIDPGGRADIIYTDDANSAQCAPTCTQGIGLISQVQQATGPSLYSGVNSGVVPPLTSSLSQSLDVRVAGANADITRNESAETVVPSVGNNVTGTYDAAADITDLKVCLTTTALCPVTNTQPNTLAFLFKVANMGTSPANAIVTPNLTANWLVTWRAGTPNDLWFAQASTDSTGSLTCIAGRPLSVYNDGEPKAAEYVGGTENSKAASVNCAANPAHNTIEIDVPFSDVGVTSSSELYGLTGWTGNSSTALPSTVCSTLGSNPSDNCMAPSGTFGFFNNVAETAPMDALLSSNQAVTPEAPLVPLIVGLGGAGALGAGYLRGRRRSRHPAG